MGYVSWLVIGGAAGLVLGGYVMSTAVIIHATFALDKCRTTDAVDALNAVANFCRPPLHKPIPTRKETS